MTLTTSRTVKKAKPASLKPTGTELKLKDSPDSTEEIESSLNPPQVGVAPMKLEDNKKVGKGLKLAGGRGLTLAGGGKKKFGNPTMIMSGQGNVAPTMIQSGQ